MKADGRLGRNHLLGAAGDAMNALLVAAGHNLRLILNWLRLFMAWLVAALMGSSAQLDPAHEPWKLIAAWSNDIVQGRPINLSIVAAETHEARCSAGRTR
jgi:IS5 family transposase